MLLSGNEASAKLLPEQRYILLVNKVSTITIATLPVPCPAFRSLVSSRKPMRNIRLVTLSNILCLHLIFIAQLHIAAWNQTEQEVLRVKQLQEEFEFSKISRF